MTSLYVWDTEMNSIPKYIKYPSIGKWVSEMKSLNISVSISGVKYSLNKSKEPLYKERFRLAATDPVEHTEPVTVAGHIKPPTLNIILLTVIVLGLIIYTL